MNTIIILIIGFSLTVLANYFLSLWISNKQEERMLNNLIKYLETVEKRKGVEG